MDQRIDIVEYALQIAEVAAKRSEDPFRKVGAVAINDENRIIATGYNGLIAHFQADRSVWKDRDVRRSIMIHAEQNLCSLFRRGEAKMVAVTTCPCSDCVRTLLAHGVSQVYYREPYETDDGGIAIAKFYGLSLIHKPNEAR